MWKDQKGQGNGIFATKTKVQRKIALSYTKQTQQFKYDNYILNLNAH